MKDCLLLLTKVFPFDKGEEFIEGEIQSLAEAFQKVIIIATSTGKHPVQTRSVPENVSVHSICASKVRSSMPGAIARQFPFKDYKGYSGRDECSLVKSSLKRKLYLSYFIAKSEIVYDESVKILSHYRLEEFDGVTFYSYWFHDVAVVAIRLKKYCAAKSKRAVSRAHGYDLYAYRNSAGYLPLRYYILKNIDNVYPCSENGSSYLKEHYPNYSDKIQTAYLGSRDCGEGKPSSGDVFQIVSCCHLTPIKRIDLLAEALRELKDSGLKLKWTHFGGGDSLEKLKAYCSDNLNFMECHFLGGIKNTELLEFYKTTPVDLFINTSSSEGLPVSIMEAGSFGIPSIATDVGGTSEIVRDGQTGFLLPADLTPDKLAQKIKEALLLPPEQKVKLRENCRSLYLENFCAEKNFSEFAQRIKPL